jgi:hypothetical protein
LSPTAWRGQRPETNWGRIRMTCPRSPGFRDVSVAARGRRKQGQSAHAVGPIGIA